MRMRLVGAALGLACLSAASGEAQGAEVSARSAASFVDSVGVNVHMYYETTPYRESTLVADKLAALGVRHVRDGLVTNRPDHYAALRALAARGIKSNLIMGRPGHRHGTLDELLRTLQGELLGAVESVEGPNEYDVAGDPLWAGALRDYQTRLYRSVKENPSLASLPVIGPSLVRPDSHDILGDVSSELDFGNLHSYPGGQQPQLANFGRTLPQALTDAAKNSKEKPVIATETGYHGALASEGGHPPASERASGIYIPRLYLEYFRLGFARTFLYELLDEQPDPGRADPEANFGLLRSDFSEKPAYVGLKRLLELLGDQGAAAPPSLRYSLTGDVQGVQQVLLAKRDGSLYLCLWSSDSVFDVGRRLDLSPPARRVTLALEQPMQSAEVYRPGSSPAPLTRVKNPSKLDLDVPPDVTVVRLSGGSSTSGPRHHGPAVRAPRSSEASSAEVRSILTSSADATLRALKRRGARSVARRGRFAIVGRRLPAGSYRVSAHVGRAGRRAASDGKRTLIANRTAHLERAGGETIRVRLTRRGRRVLSKRTGMTLTISLALRSPSGERSAIRRGVRLAP